MKIVDYITITQLSQTEFVSCVNGKIQEGYIPQGGISIVVAGENLIQMQAMVKYEQN